MPAVIGFVVRVVIAAAISYAVMSGFAIIQKRAEARKNEDEQVGV